jgi:hypothetical protein
VGLKIEKIKTIFKNHLYSVQYKGCNESEFSRLFKQWKNPELVEVFLDTNKKELDNHFWKDRNMTQSKARRLITQEAIDTEDHFFDLYENTRKGDVPDFNQEFFFLDKHVYQFSLRSKHKMYGTHEKEFPAFLRIYAIRIDNNCFLITGGSIKLTQSMNESKYLIKELEKLNNVQSWLEKEYIADSDDLNKYENNE